MLRSRFAIVCFLALAWFASPVLAACPKGEIAAKTGCVTFAAAKQEIERLVRRTMEMHKLEAVLVGVTAGGETVMREAWGESMTGVPATPDMHFRNGAVAIAYIGTGESFLKKPRTRERLSCRRMTAWKEIAAYLVPDKPL